MEDLDIDERTIIKWIFKKLDGGHGLNLIWLGQGHVTGSCECFNDPPDSIKWKEFLDCPRRTLLHRVI